MPDDNEFDDFDELDDEILLAAVEEIEVNQKAAKPVLKQKTMADFGFAKRVELPSVVQVEGRVSNPIRPSAIESHHEMDLEALKTWIYPVNYPLREYQFNIAQSSLFSNTLVCLPTGLGKTFIAAVVMYNFYKWFPEGKIVFMAPTKPLVNQQIDACYKITGIDSSYCCEMTGNIRSEIRSTHWDSKRIFFMTPETFRNDLHAGTCDARKVVLVVFDEAHRASGKYAYCDIIKELEREQAVFRVMALSATPGSETKKVQAVIQNLLIEKLQLRTEESMDVQKNIFKRTVEEVVIKPTPFLKEIIDIFIKFPEKILQRLVQHNAYRESNPMKATVYGLIMASNNFRTNKNSFAKSKHVMIRSDLYTAQQLLRSLETLVGCGMKAFYHDMFAISQEVKQSSTPSITKRDMVSSLEFKRMMEKLEMEMKKPDFYSHPKMERLSALVVDHFKNHSEGGETRIMIFSTLRATVEEIVEVLRVHSPLVRPALFVGQAKGTKNSMGMKQKDQLKVISDFHAGVFNVIVATCIGEEGLDIGDLDLIICFDNQKSPIRMLQRCGRTGRKRQGKICLLINEGKEEEAVKSARRSYKNVQNSITDGKRLDMYAGDLAGVIPSHCKPECTKMELVIAQVEKKVSEAKKTVSNGKAYLDDQQEEDYIRRFMSEDIPLQKIQLNNQLLWQTSDLPIIEMPRSDKAQVFVSLMEYFEEIKSTEAPPKISEHFLESAQSQPSVIAKLEAKKRVIATLALSTSLSSEIEIPPCLKKKGHHNNQQQDLFSLDSDDSALPVINLNPKVQESSVAGDEITRGDMSDTESVDLKPAQNFMNINRIDAMPVSIVPAKFPQYVNPENTIEYSDFEFDEIDLEQIENQFMMNNSTVQKPTLKPVHSVTPNISSSFDQSIVIQNRRPRNNVVLSSTPPVFRTPARTNADPISSSEGDLEATGLHRVLLDKRKRRPRAAPKEREFKVPTALKASRSEPVISKQKRKRQKNTKAYDMGLVDIEVQVSSDYSGTSGELSGSGYDSDLSGFIAHSQVTDTPGFYRKTFARHAREDVILKRNSPIPFQMRADTTVDESQGSLVDFVNDEIVYSDNSGILPEDQNTQDFDSMTRSDVLEKSPLGSKAEPEELELEDLFDF